MSISFMDHKNDLEYLAQTNTLDIAKDYFILNISKPVQYSVISK